LGHLDVIRRGSHIFDHLVVGVGTNPDKEPLFPPEERVHLVQQVVADLPNVEVRSFSGLAVGFVREVGAGVMLRGLRTTGDREYESRMPRRNRTLAPDSERVLGRGKEEFPPLSGSMIKQIAWLGGVWEKSPPPIIKDAVERRFREN